MRCAKDEVESFLNLSCVSSTDALATEFYCSSPGLFLVSNLDCVLQAYARLQPIIGPMA
jgi:hypothetical protein